MGVSTSLFATVFPSTKKVNNGITFFNPNFSMIKNIFFFNILLLRKCHKKRKRKKGTFLFLKLILLDQLLNTFLCQ